MALRLIPPGSRSNKGWYVRGSIGGRRIEESAGQTRAEAEAYRIRRESELTEQQAIAARPATPSFAAAVNLYLDQGGSTRYLAPILDRLGTRDVDSIGQADAVALAQALYPLACAATLRRQVWTPLRAVLLAAHRAEWRAPPNLQAPRVKTAPTPVAPVGWLNMIRPHVEPRAWAAYFMMATTSLRISEAVSLVWGEVDLHRGIAYVPTSKTGIARAVTLPRQACVIIGALASPDRPPDPAAPVFGYQSRDALDKAVRRACQRQGLPFYSSHKAGRHAFATRALQAGHSLEHVTRAGGWASGRMVSERYSHLEVEDTRGLGDSVANRLLGEKMGENPKTAAKSKRSRN
jgi:integrase